MDYDVIIIGGGPAGLSAALWCDELGLNALILEREPDFGGQLLWTYNSIENHLGVIASNGRALCDIFLRQTENRKFIRNLQTEVVEFDLENKAVRVQGGRLFSAKAIIIATGVRRRKLNVEGESQFREKGMLETGKLNKDSVKDENVVIVGGGDAAAENVLILSETASQIFLVHRRKELRARPEFSKQIEKIGNLEIILDAEITKISGHNWIESVEIRNVNSDEIRKLSAKFVLSRIGVQPNTDFIAEKIDLDVNGYVKIDELCETSVMGIFAVGDVSNPVSPTVSSAVGAGATAAKQIHSFLNG